MKILNLFLFACMSIGHAANSSFSRVDTIYSPGSGYPTAEFAKGDINNDGFLDFVGAAKSNLTSTFQVFTNRDGVACYIDMISTSVYTPRVFDVGDFNADGFRDILVAGETGGSSTVTLQLFQGTGNRSTWTSKGALESNAVKILRAKFVDLDQDKDLDIVALAQKSVGGASYLIRYSNNGSSWSKTDLDSAFHTYSTGTAAWLGVEDINQDKLPDIIAGSDNAGPNNHVLLWLNKNGSFSKQTIVSAKPVRAGAYGDLDGDKFKDLVLDRTIYLGDGMGGFTAKTLSDSPTYMADWVSIGDVNRDGLADLCVASYDDGVRLWQNQPLTGLALYLKRDAQTPKYCDIGDADYDGWNDMVYFDQYFGLLLSVVNSANIAFTADTLFTANGIFNFGVGDLEGDLDQDFVIVTKPDTWTYALSVVDNIGSGVFTQRFTATLSGTYVGPAPVTGDLDGDKLMDFVIGHNRSVVWYKQVSKTSFQFTVLVNAGVSITNLNLVDIDNDGDLDVFAKTQDAKRTLLAFINDGKGTFTKDTLDQYVGRLVEFGDVNGDKNLDFLVRSDVASDFMTTLLYGDGKGAIADYTYMRDDSLAPTIASFVDFDDDGDLDIATGSTDLRRVGWMENQGDNNSDKKVEWLHHELMRDYSPGSVIVTNLDHSGKLDMVLDPSASANPVWLTQDSTGHLSKQHLLMNDTGLTNLIATDLDHDGWMDLVGSSKGHLVWIRNLLGEVLAEIPEEPVPLLSPVKPVTRNHRKLVFNAGGSGAPQCLQRGATPHSYLRDVLGRRHF